MNAVISLPVSNNLVTSFRVLFKRGNLFSRITPFITIYMILYMI